jgi:hypothetical protein
MEDRPCASQQKSSGDVIADCNIHCSVLAQPASWESKKDVSPSGDAAHFRSVAPEAFSVVSGHKVTGANTGVGAIEKKTVGADRLIPVVFDNGRLPEKKRERKRQESGIRDMHNVGGSNVINQFEQTGPTNHGKW